jgi:hypothetical protein
MTRHSGSGPGLEGQHYMMTSETDSATKSARRPPGRSIEHRVERAAEDALAERQYVSALAVLVGLGWLAPAHVQAWRQGRIPDIETVVTAGLGMVSAALTAFRQWAVSRGLRSSETAYIARTRDRRLLRFSRSGQEGIERAYRTHWVSPELSERKRERLASQASRPPDLVVISPHGDWTCARCGGTGVWLIMEKDRPMCLPCAGMGHLVYLPSGDAALTRRARAASRLSAVVVRFSRARKRYERQGLLVEEAALQEAERECLAARKSARDRRRS